MILDGSTACSEQCQHFAGSRLNAARPSEACSRRLKIRVAAWRFIIRIRGALCCTRWFGEVINNPPLPKQLREVIIFFNWLWRESLCAIDSLLVNVLGIMYWILYWRFWIGSLAAFAFFSSSFTSFHFPITNYSFWKTLEMKGAKMNGEWIGMKEKWIRLEQEINKTWTGNC